MFKLARLNQNIPIVNPETGNPTPGFIRFWDQFSGQIEQQEQVQNAIIADLTAAITQIQDVLAIAQSAQQAANDAQTSADDAAGGTAKSGSATNPAVNITADGWVMGPQVDLTGVVAGNLTIPGSGPQQDSDVVTTSLPGVLADFDFRIVEVVLGVDEVVFTGTFTAFRSSGGGGVTTVANSSSSAVTAFTSARTSTGAVSYRIDAQRSGHIDNLTSLLLYIFARRA